ncbi:sigma-E processing peptidase SpoIIGA [Bacillus marinisedimentorum]|uniref:sigma-E processing peptidase SpoIIGA n=1 Tax=Bacillus marinisedimentorum TaxID=1821260 RepID=UPI000871F524|nr:sigma-E processing peptidase SpoIIGA [Bacillus marinisedimentorum]
MAIYLDAVWFLNFCIDALILQLTSIILKKKTSRVRLIGAAFLGSSFVLLYFTPFSALAAGPVAKLILSAFIIFTAFGFTKVRTFFQQLFMFYFVTFVIGGGMVASHFFLQENITGFNGVLATYSTGYGSPVGWAFVLVSFPVLWLFSKKRMEDAEARTIHTDQLIQVEIVIDGLTVKTKGLIDTGNQLFDPISRLPVLILDFYRTQDQWPHDTAAQLEKWVDFTVEDGREDPHEWEERLRIIPYRAVGQEQQFLTALKPDLIRLYYQNEVIETGKAVVGLSTTRLSSEDEYGCIVHPKLLLTAARTA